MTEQSSSGANLPSSNPGFPTRGRDSQRSTERIPTLSQDRSEPNDAPDFGAGLGAGSAAAKEAGKRAGRTTRRRGGRSRSTGSRSRGSKEKPSEDAPERGAAAALAEPAAQPTSEGSDPASTSKAAPRKRSRRRGGRRKKTGDSEEPAASEATEPKAAGSSRRRGRKSVASARDTSEEAAVEASDSATAKKRRKRGTRGGRRRTKKASTAVEIEFIPGEEDDLPALEELPDGAVLVTEDSEAKPGRSRKKTGRKAAKKTKSRKTTRRSEREYEDEPAEVVEPAKKRQILVNAKDPEETRVAVVEEGRIVELQMSVKKHASYVNDIYRGRVVNLESAIGAAFVDFGQGRNGFLHASDVLPRYGDTDWSLDKLLSTPLDDDELGTDKNEDEAEAEPKSKSKARGRGRGRGRPKRVRLPMEKLLKKGQMVCVQITKDAIGDKGPTLTTYISIPGRYLVLMPSLERTGVSRKIEDEKERRRLKRILQALDIPEGMGVIVRTAGVGKTKAEIKRDLDYLLLAWGEFSRRLISGRNPAPLYQESDSAVRTMRDLFTSQTESVIVDDEEVFGRMVEFTEKLMPEQLDRLSRHEGPRPLFHGYGVEQDFEKIFSRRVELPSGGSIVIDETEALVAIDVNSGRTREDGAEFEDIALKTNLEAAPEIARQIRLRDLGGIIVLDYIDMMRASSRRAVERITRELLKVDRARSKVGRISQFGLLELTRQRLGPGLNRLVYETCRRCRGSGRQRNSSSRAQAILRRLGAALALKGFSTVEVRAHPEVIEYLEKELRHELDTLEHASGRKLTLMPVPDQVEDSVLHYLRADGREVRPGGRRKR